MGTVDEGWINLSLSSLSCQETPFYDSTAKTGGDDESVCNDDAHRYPGVYWIATASKSICKIEWIMGTSVGDLTNVTHYCEIWDMTGYTAALPSNPITNGTATFDCALTTCEGTDPWTLTFTWSGSYPSVVQNNKYAITLSQHATNASNYTIMKKGTQTSDFDHMHDRWNSVKDCGLYTETQIPRIKIYAYE